ncbi:hypothetical protein FQR65_LT07395 [Abscondita terminalis]|nr:hypothetical protein FQR65_LT07395 [Abscondita terminalis]
MYISFLVSLLIIVQVYGTDTEPTVKIRQGYLKGTVQKTRNGRPFFSFQGIPYAKPPVGNLRFEEPMVAEPWQGTLDATKDHAVCVQFDVFGRNYTTFGDENCLYLNVYTPDINNKNNLPVIVYIHGGGFVKGSSNPRLWGPYLMLDKDVVFVTFNYRLGALGFLSTGDEVVPGNNGLKDQSMALKWVKDNIESLVVIPKKLQLLDNQLAEQAFIIIYYHHFPEVFLNLRFTGITPCQWSLAQEGETLGNVKQLAIALNCPTSNSNQMVECLRKIPSYTIQDQTTKFMEYNYDPSILFKPVIESRSKNAFLPEHPVEIIKSGRMSQIPFMTGITTEDGAIKSSGIYYNYSLVEKLNLNFNKILPLVLNYNGFEFNMDDFADAIRKFYFNNKDIDNDTKDEVTNMITDALFMVPARMTSELHAKHSTKPLYFYLFGYKGSTSFSKIFGDSDYDYGVCHCDDLLYLVPNSFVKHHPSAEDIRMTDVMTTLWYNFASTGNPTPEVNSLFKIKWEPVKTKNLEYYHIKDSATMTMESNLYEDRFQFWKKLSIIIENKQKVEL